MNLARLSLAFAAVLAGGSCLADARSMGVAASSAGSARATEAGRSLDDYRSLLKQREWNYVKARSRRKAVEELVELGTSDAWELVFFALSDPDPMVADEAQLAIGTLQGEESLSLCWGRDGLRARDELVQLRVAEAIGRLAIDVDVREILKRFAPASRQAKTQRALVWSIERLARRGRLIGDIAKARRTLAQAQKNARDGGVRGAALFALDALGGTDMGTLVGRALRSRRLSSRVAASAILGQLDPAQGLPMALAASSDEAPEVRLHALDALARIGSRASMLGLADRLEFEERPALRQQALQLLQSRSGMRMRMNPRAWRAWGQKQPEDWRAPVAVQAASDKPDPEHSSASFVGLPIHSDRVAFLVDFSGSMWSTTAGELTRKQRVDAELRLVLEKLPRETMFNVIPYADDPRPWSDVLRPAKPRAVRDAIDFFEGCDLRGRGNFYGAFERAVADPLVDTIVVFCDGAPTGGERWNVGLMTQLVREQRRYRPVVVDAVLVGVRGILLERWRALTAATGGRCTSVEW